MDPNWEGIDMAPIFSPFYWGTVISFMLSGITIMQAYVYFPSKDRLLIQALAGIMLVLDLVSTCLIAQGLYYYLIPHYGSLLPLASITAGLNVECGLSVIVILISQLYFAWQIYIVIGHGIAKTVVPGLVVLFAILSCAGGIGCTTIMFTESHNILTNRSHIFAVMAGIVKGSATVADLLSTVALCYYLGLSRTGISQTDSILKTLMRFIIRRGALVTLVQFMLVVLFFAIPSHLYWLAFHVNITRVYTNTFFAMLNGREHLKRSAVFTSGKNHTTSTAESQISRSFHAPSHFTESIDSKEMNVVKINQTVVISDI